MVSVDRSTGLALGSGGDLSPPIRNQLVGAGHLSADEEPWQIGLLGVRPGFATIGFQPMTGCLGKLRPRAIQVCLTGVKPLRTERRATSFFESVVCNRLMTAC
jgi:hypothetical protein